MKKSSKKVVIIGAGNIGSRHLQALKAVKIPLEIFVIDPSQASLDLSKERYKSMPEGKFSQEVNFFSEISKNIKSADLAIIATCSDIRAEVFRKLLKKTKIKYLVLEKLLFNKKGDYKSIGTLLKKTKIKTWVNCPMRTMPFYKSIQPEFKGQKIAYYGTWGGGGLMTISIHYLDQMVFMTGSDDFTVNTEGIDPKPVLSKRKGFLDLTGALRVLFKNGSVGNFVCFKDSDFPDLVQFHCDKVGCISKEKEGKALVSRAKDNWQWKEVEARVPFQSQLTTTLVENILLKGTCDLVEYEQSAKIHLQLLEPVLKFINKQSGRKYKEYPFT